MPLWLSRESGWRAVGLVAVLLLASRLSGQLRVPDAGVGPTTFEEFRLPHYDEAGQLKAELYGRRAVKEGPLLRMTDARVEVYEAGRMSMTIWAAECVYHMRTGQLTSETEVRVTRAGLQMTGEGLRWKNGETEVTILRNVRVVTTQGTQWFQKETP